MYETFFALNEKPFALTPNPRFVYLSKTHNEVYAHLLYGIERQTGFIMVTGEVGTGKTTILRTLLNHLDEKVYRVAFIFNPKLTASELLRNIAREFGINGAADNLPDLIQELNDFLLAENRAGRVPVLVIDEAQNLSGDVLEQIRLLSNLETETAKLIQIVLVGQPELQQQLNDPSLRQINQRIAVRYRLMPLNHEETTGYVLHRLKIAGRPDGNVFSSNALSRIYQASRGVPRLINLICDRAMLAAYSDERGVVSPQDIRQAQRELAGEYEPVGSGSVSRSLRWVIVLFLGVLVAAGLYLWLQNNPPPQTPSAAVEPAERPAAPVHKETVAQQDSVNPPPVVVVAVPENRPTVAPPVALPPPVAACNALLEAWNGPPVATDNPVAAFDPETVLRLRGLEILKLRGTFAQLQLLNLPFYIVRSEEGNLAGHAVLAAPGDEWRVVPAWNATESLSAGDLAGLGSLDVYMPWKDFAGIDYVGMPGDSGESVLNLQRLLGMVGVLKGTPSGRYDQETIQAVKAFQGRRGLITDGIVGPRTLVVLYQASGAYATPTLD